MQMSVQDEWAKLNQVRHNFHRDPRVLKARKQYRADLKAGDNEKQAWARLNAVLEAVRKERGEKVSEQAIHAILIGKTWKKVAL